MGDFIFGEEIKSSETFYNAKLEGKIYYTLFLHEYLSVCKISSVRTQILNVKLEKRSLLNPV